MPRWGVNRLASQVIGGLVAVYTFAGSLSSESATSPDERVIG
jgi:hypothetical protein